uniref:Uncharacterized protein n=1 Tax=Anguilla anguilla TaxID=7936 RepID=A0A0E9S8B0_ANGAN
MAKTFQFTCFSCCFHWELHGPTRKTTQLKIKVDNHHSLSMRWKPHPPDNDLQCDSRALERRALRPLNIFVAGMQMCLHTCLRHIKVCR